MLALLGFLLTWLNLPFRSKGGWQNGYAERLIGSIRRESTDHVVAFGAKHLRRILRIGHWTRTPPFTGWSSALASSRLGPSSVDFTTNIAESSFRYTHPKRRSAGAESRTATTR